MKNYKEGVLFPDFDSLITKPRDDKAKEKWFDQKCRNFGLELCTNAIKSGKYGIPLLPAYTGTLPNKLITFSEINNLSDTDAGVTGTDYDFELDKIWYNPDKYISSLTNYKCFAEPDFSLCVGSPLSVQIANTFRSHVIAYYAVEHSVKVLPNMSWSDTRSYDFCFDGHSKGGAVMVSTIGTLRDERSQMFFQSGFMEMLRRISPDSVLLYGDVNENILSWMPSQLHIQHVEHNRFKRARKHGR
ncbi:MAG: DUF4417 domain-containing protein [Prevotella sp.]|nr:DUF4417 domain-containing protein [Prevotella sp.]